MQENKHKKQVLIDGSRLIIEALARAGADAFIGYPITPANLLYLYGNKRMNMMLPAPDEITTVQWMAGLAMTGKLPVTATSFPGFALMIESINMAYMMELPMVIVLVQRLGPATGTATCGAQGDLLLLKGMISGGHPLPVLATSDFSDCWTLAGEAAKMAVSMRTPVVLLTSKEEVMTQRSFPVNTLPEIEKVTWHLYESNLRYSSYKPTGLVPDYLSLNQKKHQVRFNASTHDEEGILQHSNPESMSNTRRLEDKIRKLSTSHLFYEYDEQQGAEKLIVAYGITAMAAKQAVCTIRKNDGKVSLLIPKTIWPLPTSYIDIIGQYKRVVVAEETINNQLGNLIWGQQIPEHVGFVGNLGSMITPEQIIEETWR